MIAVAVSLLFALYVLGPDALSRFVLGLTLPRRNVILSKSEEVSRALIWAVASFGLAYLWSRSTGALSAVWHPASLRTCFSGLYSERFFEENRASWFASLHDVFWINWCLLWRLYAVTVVLSLGLTFLTHYYGWLRNRIPGAWLRAVFAGLVLPRVAQWHVLLSKVLLADRSLSIHLDILTNADKLYQGRFIDKALGADGTLISVTLADPRRFDRDTYSALKAEGAKPDSADFWKQIPTNVFVVMASGIHTINLRYRPSSPSMQPLKAGSPELLRLLETIADEVNALRAQPVQEDQPPE